MTTEIAEAALSQQLIVFQLNEEEFALDVSQVKSIERIQPVTRVPGTASFVKGVINLRGVITPVIDLNERFGSDAEVTEKTAKIIIAAINDVEAGLIVDEANDVIDILADSIEAPPEAEGNVSAEYIKGVVKHNGKILILLNLDKVLNPDELRATEK
ncbi:chemotaxis protein CheW [Fictibacillus aquaticus]|uniref:Chemotaxis protein CheW n=1 Tax=Fictibacillus aquaticus TaxID=2021314 RepID=A0A235FBY8_9BACL|nr:chemotaxis protein CheW [Fictibacillus aquaticus]OYD58836.1 chemotaxis protein CheW [Fictibacillus aquaticus]